MRLPAASFPSRAGGVGPFWHHDTFLIAETEIHVAFTSVQAGNLSPNHGQPGEAARNLAALESLMGAAPGSLCVLSQVHSDRVCDAAAGLEDGRPPVGDAWICRGGGQPLAIRVADCMPVMMLGRSEEGIVTAGAHAGRPGLLGGVLERTVERLRQEGAEQITAWIGPSACGRCYEIPGAMVEEIAAERPAIRSRTRWGTAALDLRAEAAVVLDRLGVAITDLGGCTLEDETLFSHRRSQAEDIQEGRFAGLIWCR